MKATIILASTILCSIAGFSQVADVKGSWSLDPTLELIKTKTQKKFTVPAFKQTLPIKSIIVPIAFIGYGFTTLGNNSFRQLNKNISYEVKEDMPGFKTSVDDYLRYAPVVSTYALNIAGVKGKHRLLDRTIVFAVSSIATNQIVTVLKHATHQLRPD